MYLTNASQRFSTYAIATPNGDFGNAAFDSDSNHTFSKFRIGTDWDKRVAFLWDFLFQGNVIFETIERELSRRYSGMSFVGWREIGNIHGKDEREMVAALPARLKAAGVDAVITAVAA